MKGTFGLLVYGFLVLRKAFKIITKGGIKMGKTEKKKKSKGKQWIVMLLFMAIGFACGLVMIDYVEASGGSPAKSLGKLLFLFIMMYIMILVQMVIHEAGHLVFGLASGYRFSSFRIMNFMWLKENGKIRHRRFSLAGTGGQCLMGPPDLQDGKIPVILYNLGGALMNMITALIFFCLYCIVPDSFYFSIMMLMLAIIGVGIAVMNGVPLKLGMVNNDGYNAYELSKGGMPLRAFWLQLKVNEQIAKGIRLKDMPEEWFSIPSDDEMQNGMIAVKGVLVCNRLMDRQDFEEADKLMQHFLEIDSGIVGLHRCLLVCDRMYCGLISGRKENVEALLTKEQKNLMKSMKKSPSVLRTEYTYALLGKNDVSKAEKIKALFETCAKTYPYQIEVDAERGLMCIADRQMEI